MRLRNIKGYLFQRNCRVLITGVFALFLTACGVKNSISEEWLYSGGNRTVSENGVYFFDDRVLQLYDAEAGISMPLCQRAECLHKGEECSAYYEALSVLVVPADKQLYLITDADTKEFGDLNLFTCDYAGESRKRIDTISVGIQQITAACWKDDVLYLGYTNAYSSDIQDLEKSIAGLVSYSLKDGKSEVLWNMEAYGAQIVRLSFIEDCLVMETSYSDLSPEEQTAAFENGEFQKMFDTSHVQWYEYDKEAGVQQSNKTNRAYDEPDNSVYYPTDMENTAFYSFYENGSNYYVMRKTDTGKETKVAQSAEFIPLYIGKKNVVGYFFGNGDGVFATVPTEDFLKGDFSNLRRDGRE